MTTVVGSPSRRRTHQRRLTTGGVNAQPASTTGGTASHARSFSASTPTSPRRPFADRMSRSNRMSELSHTPSSLNLTPRSLSRENFHERSVDYRRQSQIHQIDFDAEHLRRASTDSLESLKDDVHSRQKKIEADVYKRKLVRKENELLATSLSQNIANEQMQLAETSLKKSQSLLANLKKEKKALDARIVELTNIVSDKEKNNRSLQTDLRDAQRQNNRLQVEIEELRKKLVSQSQDLREAAQRAQSMTLQHREVEERFEREREELVSKVNARDQSVQRMSEQISMIREQHESQIAINQQLETQVEQYGESLKQARSEGKTSANAHASLQTEIVRLNALNSENAKKMNQQQGTLQQRDSQLRDEIDRSRVLEEQITELREQLSLMQEQTQRQNDHANTAMQKTQSEFSAMKQRIELAEARYTEAHNNFTAQLERYDTQVSSLQSRLELEQQAKTAAESAANVARQQLQEARVDREQYLDALRNLIVDVPKQVVQHSSQQLPHQQDEWIQKLQNDLDSIRTLVQNQLPQTLVERLAESEGPFSPHQKKHLSSEFDAVRRELSALNGALEAKKTLMAELPTAQHMTDLLESHLARQTDTISVHTQQHVSESFAASPKNTDIDTESHLQEVKQAVQAVSLQVQTMEKQFTRQNKDSAKGVVDILTALSQLKSSLDQTASTDQVTQARQSLELLIERLEKQSSQGVVDTIKVISVVRSDIAKVQSGVDKALSSDHFAQALQTLQSQIESSVYENQSQQSASQISQDVLDKLAELEEAVSECASTSQVDAATSVLQSLVRRLSESSATAASLAEVQKAVDQARQDVQSGQEGTVQAVNQALTENLARVKQFLDQAHDERQASLSSHSSTLEQHRAVLSEMHAAVTASMSAHDSQSASLQAALHTDISELRDDIAAHQSSLQRIDERTQQFADDVDQVHNVLDNVRNTTDTVHSIVKLQSTKLQAAPVNGDDLDSQDSTAVSTEGVVEILDKISNLQSSVDHASTKLEHVSSSLSSVSSGVQHIQGATDSTHSQMQHLSQHSVPDVQAKLAAIQPAAEAAAHDADKARAAVESALQHVADTKNAIESNRTHGDAQLNRVQTTLDTLGTSVDAANDALQALQLAADNQESDRSSLEALSSLQQSVDHLQLESSNRDSALHAKLESISQAVVGSDSAVQRLVQSLLEPVGATLQHVQDLPQTIAQAGGGSHSGDVIRKLERLPDDVANIMTAVSSLAQPEATQGLSESALKQFQQTIDFSFEQMKETLVSEINKSSSSNTTLSKDALKPVLSQLERLRSAHQEAISSRAAIHKSVKSSAVQQQQDAKQTRQAIKNLKLAEHMDRILQSVKSAAQSVTQSGSGNASLQSELRRVQELLENGPLLQQVQALPQFLEEEHLKRAALPSASSAVQAQTDDAGIMCDIQVQPQVETVQSQLYKYLWVSTLGMVALAKMLAVSVPAHLT